MPQRHLLTNRGNSFKVLTLEQNSKILYYLVNFSQKLHIRMKWNRTKQFGQTPIILTFLWLTNFINLNSRYALLAWVTFWKGLLNFLMATFWFVTVSTAALEQNCTMRIFSRKRVTYKIYLFKKKEQQPVSLKRNTLRHVFFLRRIYLNLILNYRKSRYETVWIIIQKR